MNTKLTLSIERSVIEKAKQYAKMQGRSLSDIVENFLISITNEQKKKRPEQGQILRSLRGSFKAPGKDDYKKALSEILANKHLK